jgi:hypothetical protein
MREECCGRVGKEEGHGGEGAARSAEEGEVEGEEVK